MQTKLIAGSGLAALVVAGALAGTVSAQTAAEATGLTAVQAIEIALAEVPGEVEEVELERENGARVYEIEIVTAENAEFEIEIDAVTGEIIEIEAEDDDHDDDDDDD